MYKVTAATEESIQLEPNQNWYNAANESFKISKVMVRFYSTIGDAFNSLKIGNIDMVCTALTNVEDYIGTIGFSTEDYKGRQLDFLSLNCEDNLLEYKEVRQAINYAIDKKKINSRCV